MKQQRHPSGFGPRSRRLSRPKVRNGSMTKRSRHRFRSMRMKKIVKEVRYSNARMQQPLVMANEKNRKRNYNVMKDQVNHVSPKVKQQPTKSGNDTQWTTDAMKRKYPQILKMKQGLIDHSNNTKTSSRPNNLKAMPGLVINSKGKLNVDQQVATLMQSRDPMNGCNDTTNDENMRGIKETLAEEKPKPHDENGTKGENPTHMMKKRRKFIDRYEDEDEDENDDPILVNDTRVKSQDVMVKGCHAKTTIPSVVDCLKKQCYCCSKPIDEPIWSGLLKISNKEYIPLAGHLSTKSCKKVHNLSKPLSRMLEVTKTPRSNVWPKRWEGSRSSVDNIGLYFFPIKMRPDKYYDQLLKEIMENDLSLQAIIGDVEMLIFPSNLLPEQYQTFQMKHYLWGVFKPREVEKRSAILHNPDEATVNTANAIDTVSLGATRVATDASSTPIKDATSAPDSSDMGAPSGKMVAFVVRQTPRLDQLIREIEREGSLVMRGDMESSTPWLANMATATKPGQSNKHN